MIHLGDITKLNGYEVPVIDVITGGSPCQNFSVAGNRKGLGGDESVLFYHQIRLVKEMREHDRRTGRAGMYVRPRYCIWENVPGAFSSNGGKDFQAVLTEFVRIAEPEAPDVPMPEKGKWPKSGCLYDELGRWSIAWRVHDAQFWGVAQRRKRLSLIADFGGLSAPETLFERKGLRWHPEQSGEAREDAAGRTEGSTGSAISYGISSYDSNAMKSPNPHSGIYRTETSRTLDLNGGNPACNQGGMAVLEKQVFENHSQDSRYKPLGATCETVSAKYGTGGNNMPLVIEPLSIGNGQADSAVKTVEGVCHTLNCMHDPMAVMTYQTVTDPLMANSHPGSYTGQDAYNDMLVAHTLKAKGGCDFREDGETYPITSNIVRRLTPLECERLQGFPDNWTDIGDWTDSKGRLHKAADSPRYKALGSSIALPFWQYLARRICAQYERNITMASLFDGIGGFPLVFERCGAKAVWASEIEEFPMAVTKMRFKEET